MTRVSVCWRMGRILRDLGKVSRISGVDNPAASLLDSFVTVTLWMG